MHVKKGDNVLVITGKDKGKKGKILRAIPKEERVVVEGTNLRQRRIRPRKRGDKGQTVELPAPMHASNVRKIT